jgi:hypothetical protein
MWPSKSALGWPIAAHAEAFANLRLDPPGLKSALNSGFCIIKATIRIAPIWAVPGVGFRCPAWSFSSIPRMTSMASMEAFHGSIGDRFRGKLPLQRTSFGGGN